IKHGARHGWSRLRWLLDINQFINKGMDWSHIFNIAKNYQSLHIIGQGIALSRQLFETEIPGEIESTFISDRSVKLAKQSMYYFKSMINLHTVPLPIEVSHYHKHYLFSLMCIQQKTLFLMSFLFPYPEDTETLQLPIQLHFLYFPLRPLLWI